MAVATHPGIDFVKYAEEHLFYEVQMFLLARNALPGKNQFEMNAMLEVCLLHLRNLIDFFYYYTPPDDVVAEHYVADWAAKRPAIPPALTNAKQRANKELAHLTTQRISGTPAHKAWDFGALGAELRPVIAVFLREVGSTFPARTRTELLKL